MSVKLDHGDDELTENHEINVTPFIDVMLVLLIVFMVAAPLATVDVPVDLPVSTAERQPKPNPPLYLTLKSDLSFVLKDAPVSREALGKSLDEAIDSLRSTEGAGSTFTLRLPLRLSEAVTVGGTRSRNGAIRQEAVK